ncbi:acyl-[acyl-carrier-protein] thioesterase [Bacillus andreraoultii]|uniref:acyl-[acyl-carrier-protein] thioesterase n=1 Tax=Bacillus andreraoultii TaxID=1499685 RepID=UPI00053A6D4E|nr:acyl-ACP thioesterase domain-containing protein [Bacillus andreraoultii]
MESITYRTNMHVDLRDVDFAKELKLSTLFSYFQDVASLAAENLGWGIEQLAYKYGVAWVLMRIRVEVTRMPKYNEEITIETWPHEPKRIEFERDFLVRNTRGDILIKASSIWVLMDINERKLKRNDSIGIQYPAVREERALNNKLSKLQDYGNIEKVYKKVIGYSDIDFNGHLNNSKYVDYVMDVFPIEKHNQFEVKSVEMNFNNEAFPGETIILYKDITQSEDDIIYIEGRNEDNSKTLFKSLVEIKER